VCSNRGKNQSLSPLALKRFGLRKNLDIWKKSRKKGVIDTLFKPTKEEWELKHDSRDNEDFKHSIEGLQRNYEILVGRKRQMLYCGLEIGETK